MSGLLKCTNGSISINNNELNNLSQKELDKFRGQHIGIVFQKPEFISSLSVLENLQLKNKFSKGIKKSNEELLTVLESLGIEELFYKKINELSLGQQQRLSVAIALINNPDILLADEPTSSLDDANAEKVIELLKTQSKNKNLIVITHDNRIKHHFEQIIELQQLID